MRGGVVSDFRTVSIRRICKIMYSTIGLQAGGEGRGMGSDGIQGVRTGSREPVLGMSG